MLCIQVILLHCMPMSCVYIVNGLRNSAFIMSGSFSPSNSATTTYCSVLASLALFNFLCFGGELKAKTTGTASGLSIHLDGSNPSRTDET